MNGASLGNCYMSPPPAVYKQPMYDYSVGHMNNNHYHRKNSESAAIHLNGMNNQSYNKGFKSACFPKKTNARKRISSTNEGWLTYDTHKFYQFSGNLSHTKDSSTSSCAKYGSPTSKINSGMPLEPKSAYLLKLRQCIKEKGDKSITTKDMKGHVSEISQDQIGSRFIQDVYEDATPEERNSK